MAMEGNAQEVYSVRYMRIAYVTNSPAQSGMGKPAREIFKRLSNHKNDLFYLDGKENKLMKNDSLVVEKKAWSGPLKAKPVQWWRLSRELPRKGYDLWHLTNQTLSFIPRKPYVLTVYDIIEIIEPQEKMGGIIAKYLYKGIKKAEHVICISEYTKRTVQEFYGIAEEKISIIPLGVGLPFTPMKNARQTLGYLDFLREQKLPAEAKIVLYVGSDHPRKNLLVLAEAFKKVKQVLPQAYFVKVGEPGLKEGRELLLKKVDELKIRDNVRFVGNTSDETLSQYYGFADVFVFPSVFEGFGIPPLEAMSCGTPVVSSGATSLPEVVGKAGLLCKPHDVDCFARSILDILKNRNQAEELSKKGIERAKIFGWEEIARKTEEVYEKVLVKYK